MSSKPKGGLLPAIVGPSPKTTRAPYVTQYQPSPPKNELTTPQKQRPRVRIALSSEESSREGTPKEGGGRAGGGGGGKRGGGGGSTATSPKQTPPKKPKKARGGSRKVKVSSRETRLAKAQHQAFKKQLQWVVYEEQTQRDGLESLEEKLRYRLSNNTVTLAEARLTYRLQFVVSREEKQRCKLELTESSDREILQLSFQQITCTLLSSKVFGMARLLNLEVEVAREQYFKEQATQRIAVRTQQDTDRAAMMQLFEEKKSMVHRRVAVCVEVRAKLDSTRLAEISHRLSIISAELISRQAVEQLSTLEPAVLVSRAEIEKDHEVELVCLVQQHILSTTETAARDELENKEESQLIDIKLCHEAQLTKIRHSSSVFQSCYTPLHPTGVDWICAVEFWARWAQKASRRPQCIFSLLEAADTTPVTEAQISLYLEKNCMGGSSSPSSPSKRRTQMFLRVVDKQERHCSAICRTSPLVDGEWHHCLFTISLGKHIEFWTDGTKCDLSIVSNDQPTDMPCAFTCVSGPCVGGTIRLHTPGSYCNYPCWGIYGVDEAVPENRQIQLAVVAPQHNGSDHPEEHPQNSPYVLAHNPQQVPMPAAMLRTYRLHAIDDATQSELPQLSRLDSQQDCRELRETLSSAITAETTDLQLCEELDGRASP